MTRVLGTVTIGQSPRTDLIPEMKMVMGTAAMVLEAGALDGLTLQQVKELAPEPGDYVLITRMADGTAVKIAEKHILSRMQEKIDDLVARGADAVALVCTGEFPPFHCERLLVVPQKVLFHAAAAVVNEQEGFRLGVLLPDADQIEQGLQRWRAITPEVRIEAESPYGRPGDVEEAAHKLRQWGAGLVVMDCIGYTLAMKESVRRVTGVPVILARSILARTLAELA